MVSFLCLFFNVVALMLLGMVFFLVVLVLFLIDLMKRGVCDGSMLLFVLMMNFLVVLTGFLMVAFMLVMLDGSVLRFWFILLEPLSELFDIMLLLFEILGKFLLLSFGLLGFMVVLSMEMMFAVMATGGFVLSELIDTANDFALFSWVFFGTVFVVEESIGGAKFLLIISLILCFLSSGCLSSNSSLLVIFCFGLNSCDIFCFFVGFCSIIVILSLLLILFVVSMGLLMLVGLRFLSKSAVRRLSGVANGQDWSFQVFVMFLLFIESSRFNDLTCGGISKSAIIIVKESINWIQFSFEFFFGCLFCVLFIHVGVSSIDTTNSWCSLSILLLDAVEALFFHHAHVEIVFGSLKL